MSTPSSLPQRLNRGKALVFVFITGLLLFSIYKYFFSPVYADEIDDLQNQITQLKQNLASTENSKKQSESQLTSLQRQLAQIKISLQNLSNSITQKEADLKIREEKLSTQQDLLKQRVRSYYMRSFLTDPIIIILSSNGPGEIFRDLAYRIAASKEDQRVIKDVTSQISQLTKEKDKLVKDKASLASFQDQTNKNAIAVDNAIKKYNAQAADLNTKIAQLSARQQQLIAEKLASLNLPVLASSGQSACVDDRNKDPGFSPRFALYSFGVNNHIGLNQYGAKGRAAAGQTAEQILGAYYGNYTLNKSYSTAITITVNGYSPEYNQNFSNEQYNIEDYVKHLYEMPTGTDWGMEALKAQAIAARSYVLATTSNGQKPTCPSQSCQVIKHEINSTRWQQAVDATAGWVMVSTDNNLPITAWFSSVHGGYVYKSSDIGWSASSWTKNGIDGPSTPQTLADLAANSYDKDAPWFYCDWGSRSNYLNTAWLTSAEFADLINVANLAKIARDTGDNGVISHLSQIDKPNPDGVDTWSPDRVKQELKTRGGNPVNTVSAATISWDTNLGKTTSVQVIGDTGTQIIDASTFKTYFNLRAPANLQIVSLLYNIEKK